MKIKFPILLFIFGLFLFLLPNFAEAMCPITCQECRFNMRSDSYCWGKPDDDFIVYEGAGVERVGTIGDVVKSVSDGFWVDSPCYYDDKACANENFPSLGGYNGQVCKAWDRCAAPACADGWGGSDCIQPGRWDASESQCVSCNGEKEEWVRGDTTDIYAGCSGFPSGCNTEGIQGTNYGKCESACGANTACDEVSDESQCTVGKYCEALGRNCLSGDTCSGCVCVAPPLKPTIAFSPSSFTFTAVLGGSNPANQTLEIWNSGAGGTTLNWSVSDNATWLTLSPTSGSSTGEHDSVTLSVNISGRTAGSYSATITISDPNATNNPRTVPVSLDITAPNLQISDIEEFGTDQEVHFTVYNEGDASTGDSFYCSLYVDGTYEDYEYFSSLNAGATDHDVFSGWACTPGQTYSIEVCADDKDGTERIVESDENDNCRTENLTCPAECTGSINVSPETDTAPCDFTIDIYNVDYCQGLTWEVTRDGSYVDSDTVTGNTNWTETIYDNGIGVDNYTYRLYIDNDLKHSDSVVCQEETPSTCAEAGGTCKANSCSTYEDCSPAAENYDCSGATPYCCLGSCTTPPPEFDFSISIDPDFGSVIQGGSTSPSTVTATLISGTSQSVSFYVGSGLPSGASDSFSPPSCNPTCSSSMIIYTSATTPPGVYQITVCGTTGIITNCYSYYELTVTEAGPGISPPEVRTVPISEQGTVTTDSATIWGELTDMGGADSCLVRFEYKKSIDTVWTEVCETTKTSIGSFSCPLTDLTSNTTYDFEAFAKNGGSW